MAKIIAIVLVVIAAVCEILVHATVADMAIDRWAELLRKKEK